MKIQKRTKPVEYYEEVTEFCCHTMSDNWGGIKAINFISHQDRVTIRDTQYNGNVHLTINYCPFCGTKIEVKK